MSTATTDREPDLRTALSEAERAAQAAADAQAKAAAAVARAAQAQVAAELKRQAARERWARKVVDEYPTARQEADHAVATARATFRRVAVEEPVETVPAYLAYANAVYARFLVGERAKAAARLLQLPRLHGEPTMDRPAPPMNFLNELGDAVNQAVMERLDLLEQARRDEQARVSDGTMEA